MMHAWDSSKMKKKRLTEVLTQLSTIFEMPLAHYFRNTAKEAAVDEQLFSAKLENLNNSTVKASVLAGEGEA